VSATPCPRLFEAEAMRDGRLTGAERAHFERHVTGCPACSSEVRALEALAESLRTEFLDHTVADEVRARRERMRLMAAFDRALLAPEPSRNARHWLLWPAAVSALVVAILLVLPRVRRPAEPPTHPLSAVVHADSTSVWSERRDGDREHVVLERGALWIHVDHSSGKGRLLVVLPDGELEDIGTTFTVSADDGHTTRVAVQEGHVVLRVRGQAAVALGPGDTWAPDPRPVASARASAPPANPAPSARLDAVERSAPPTPPPSAPLASPTASNSSVDFRAAMAALDVGDNHQAAGAFATFLEKHPRDPRAEDAAYLRVIALQRSGDSAGMKQAAVEYLRLYPAGFRQAEVEALSKQ
jgi:ferric-dicitrate binding protein FerR (iron transport regulator)